MLRRKFSCYGLALLLLYGAFGNSVGQNLDVINASSNVTTDAFSTVTNTESIPTSENPTTVATTTGLDNATTSWNPTTVATTVDPDNFTTPETPTTVATSTTEMPVITTTVPTPDKPDLGPYTWSVYDAVTNTTCIVLKLQPEIFVPYTNTSMQETRANITVPSNATASGSCYSDDVSSTAQYIMLNWPSSAGLLLPYHSLTLGFTKNHSEGQDYVFSLASVSILIQPDAEYFPNISTVDRIEAYNNTLNLYPTHANNSYRCNAAETIDLVSNRTTMLPAQVTLRNMQVEAFRSQADNHFSRAVDCPADAVLSSDIVPIAVGCALAALVVVVLIAYLIGRRRARQRGYQSV